MIVNLDLAMAVHRERQLQLERDLLVRVVERIARCCKPTVLVRMVRSLRAAVSPRRLNEA